MSPFSVYWFCFRYPQANAHAPVPLIPCTRIHFFTTFTNLTMLKAFRHGMKELTATQKGYLLQRIFSLQSSLKIHVFHTKVSLPPATFSCLYVFWSEPLAEDQQTGWRQLAAKTILGTRCVWIEQRG